MKAERKHFFTEQELKDWINSVGGTKTKIVAPKDCYVISRNELLYNNFLSGTELIIRGIIWVMAVPHVSFVYGRFCDVSCHLLWEGMRDLKKPKTIVSGLLRNRADYKTYLKIVEDKIDDWWNDIKDNNKLEQLMLATYKLSEIVKEEIETHGLGEINHPKYNNEADIENEVVSLMKLFDDNKTITSAKTLYAEVLRLDEVSRIAYELLKKSGYIPTFPLTFGMGGCFYGDY